MRKLSPAPYPGTLKVFVACLLSFAILITPIAAIAAPRTIANPATKAGKKQGAVAGEASKASTENLFANAPVPEPAPAPPFAANLTATMTDNRPGVDPASAKPGETINYTVTIQNTGDADANGVQFNDDVDAHTAYVANSGLLAMADAYSTIGDVQISVPDGATDLLGNDLDLSANNNNSMTATAQTVSSANCTGGCSNNVTINANGSFTYDPPVGFTGTDSFNYVSHNANNTRTAIAKVQITVTGRIWFINNTAGACTSNCDGRLSHPFQTLAAFQAVNDNAVALNHPKVNDTVFIYTGTANYTGGTTLLNGQKLIGQGATASLETITGLATPSGSTTLPSTGGANPVLSTGSPTDNVRLGTGNSNLIRGFTVGDSGTATGDSSDISGTNIGTLTVSEVTLNGSGRTMNINGGALSGSFTSVTSTASTGGGLTLGPNLVTGSINMGSTTISGWSTGCISVSNTTANVTFGNTSCTGGTGSEGVNLTNNSGGTRTFGTLTVSGITATAFIHSTGGGDVNITGAANLSTAGNAISVSTPANGDLIDFQAATSVTTTGNGVTGINWVGASGAIMQFSSLSIQRNNGAALNATTGGTINVTNATGSINNTTPNGPAITANSVALNANFSQINCGGGTNCVSLTTVTGTSNFGAGALSGATGATFLVNGGTASVTYTGNITQATAAQPLVSISNGHNTGTITFDAGTLSATNGTGLQFDNADGTYNFNTTAGSTTLTGAGDEGIDILNGSAGTFTFGRAAAATSFVIDSPSGIAFNLDGGATTSTANVAYHGNMTQTNNASLIVVKNHNTGTITFDTGTLSASNGNGIQFDNADSTTSYNFNGTTNLTVGGDAGVDILNGSGGTFSFSSNTTITNPTGTAFNVSASAPNSLTYAGTITANNARAVSISNAAAAACGTQTFNNSITGSGASASGILVNNCSSGTINFSGSTLTLSTQANNALTLTGNAGATINFSGGNQSLTTTNGHGISATGGGAIGITGNDNTITTTGSGRAVDWAMLSGAHSSGTLRFKSINKSGSGTKGIVVNFHDGSFTVHGDDDNNGSPDSATSGGTITGTTQRGAEFVSVSGGVSLAGMTFTNATTTDGGSATVCGVDLINNDNTTCNAPIHLQTIGTSTTLRTVTVNGSAQTGINGLDIRALAMTTVSVTNSGNAVNEHGVVLKNLRGTNTITSSTFSSNRSRQLYVINTIDDSPNPVPTLSITASTFSNSVDLQGALFDSYNSGNIVVNVGDDTVGGANTFSNNFSNALQQSVGLGGDMTINIKRNTFNHLVSGIVLQAAGVGATSTLNYTIWNNTVVKTDLQTNNGSGAIIVSGTQQHQISGDIRGNTIGNGTAGSGAFCGGGCNGITVDHNDISAAGGGRHDVTIIGNTVRNVDSTGIRAVIGQKSKGNITITGNLIQDPDGATFSAIYVQGGIVAADPSCIAATIGGTVTPGAWPSTTANAMNRIVGSWDPAGFQSEIFVWRKNTTGGTFNIPGLVGSTNADVVTFLGARNSIPDATGADVTASGGPFGNTASCPLMLALGGISSAQEMFPLVTPFVGSGFRSGRITQNVATTTVGESNHNFTNFTSPTSVSNSLTQQQLDSIVVAAFEHWSGTGLTAKQLAAMRELRFEVGDLGDAYLGEVSGNHVVVDRDAQGKGWFVDTTPADNLEFNRLTSGTRGYTSPFTLAAGRIDLLTAIEHEIGHKLGLGDLYGKKDRDNLMYGYLTVGERRSPAKGQAVTAETQSTSIARHLLLGYDDEKLAVSNNKSAFKGLTSGIIGEKPEAQDQRSETRLNHARSVRTTKGATTSRALAPVPFAPCGPINTPAGHICVDIGTLHAGDSVQISFSVTVNNPPNLSLLPPNARVTTQGVVSATALGSVNTDDPDTGTAGDTTDTPIDLFDVKFDSITSDVNPSSPTDPVTYTATISKDNTLQNSGAAVPTGSITFRDNGVDIGTCTNVAISGAGPWTAQCTIPAGTYTGGTNHPISAKFNGDGNFDQLTSGTLLTQVVQNCNAAAVVTKIADTNDGTCDADCSLREAIATACNSSTITFDTAGVFATAQTITLTMGELSIAGNMTIDGPDGATQRVTINGGGANRVFNVNSGKTVTIRDLNIMNGLVSGAFPANCGGAIYNDHATLTLIGLAVTGSTADNGGGACNNGRTSGSASLTIIDSTFSGNTATSDGGAIHNSGLNGSATLSITNSTLSTNNANFSGGGVFTDGTGGVAPIAITNCTIAQNRADNDTNTVGSGGGLAILGGSAVTLRNSIVDLNWFGGSPSTTADDITGAVIAGGASTHNIIGSCTSCGLTDNVDNNKLNVPGTTLKLGTLNPNGGPVQTHSLLSGSIALEAGNNAYVVAPPFLNVTPITDNRGTGYPRIADSADVDTTATVDVGAYEAHPTIEDIADKTTAEDTALTPFVFNIGDGTGALITSVTAVSNNTTVVPNDLAHLSVSAGPGATRTLSITPATNANTVADGAVTITVTVTATNGQIAQDDFALIVTEVNDVPDAINDGLSAVDEDSGQRTIPFADLLGNDTNKGAANEAGQSVTVTGVSNFVGGTATLDTPNSQVLFTPNANFSGTASFDYTITDNGTTNTVLDAKSDTATASFTVNAINDAPSFTKGADPTVNEDAGAQTVVGWATAISQGAGGETGQTPLTFNISPNGTTGNISFASGPAINSTTGTLTYTTNADTNGTATFDVTLTDSGPTGGSNVNTSGVQTFTITVNAVNDAPTFIKGADPTVNEDAALQTVPGFASSFQPGPVTATDEGTQTLVGYTLTQTGTTGGLTFTTAPAIDTSGVLTFQPAPDKNGTATYDIVATDNGPSGGSNVNQSAPVSFTITVNAQNDNPTLTTNSTLAVVNGGTGTIDNTKLKVDDVDNTAAQIAFTIGTAPANGILKKGVTVLAAGNSFTQDDINTNQITYQHTNLASIVDSFTFTVSDGAGGTIGTTTFNITTGCGNSIAVTSTADNGNGTLRQAITGLCDGGTISFNIPGGGPDTITLTSGELVIDKSLTINGPTAKSLTISGNLSSRVFNVNAGKTGTITSLTVNNGRAAFGAGIYNQGTLTIIASTINGNVSANGADNGAGNGANGGDGGGIYNSGTLNVINSTISGNNAGNGGNATGGIGVGVGGNGGNGGGIYNGGTLLLINDSISQNRAGRNGLNVNGDDTNVDLGTPGQGGGVFTTTTTAILRNTIIAGNLTTFFSHNVGAPGTNAQDNDSDGGGTVDSSSSFNLIGVMNGLSGITPGSNGNQTGDPLFGPLTNNGGPTATYLPAQFSPAIDMGSNALATDHNSVALTTDQRGAGFPRILNGTVDIGAVETTPPPPPPPSADIGVSKLANVTESLADRDIIYTINVFNAGPDTAATVALNDTLPGNLTFVSLSAPGGWSCTTPSAGAGGTVNCTNPNVVSGTNVVFTLTVHIPSGTPGGTNYHNIATITTVTADPNNTNNSSPADTDVVTCLTNPIVTSNADSGAGTLRQAIADACDGSIIVFDPSLVGPITLTTGELLITKNLTIQGPGANLLTISGNNASRIFNLSGGTTNTISGLTLSDARVQSGGTNHGGAIFNNAALTIIDSAISGSRVAGGTSNQGGGIFNTGTLTLTNTTLSGNLAISNTNTTQFGGGLANNGTATLVNCTISGNSVSGSAASTNRGGGIYVGAGTLTIVNSTLSANSAGAGATSEGGGVDRTGGTSEVRNTIIAGNSAGTGPDLGGTFTSKGNNLVGKSDGSTGFTNGVNNDKVGTIASPLNAVLAALGNYGGPTQTHALLPGSPAIDAANNCVVDDSCVPALGQSITTDQRGSGRLFGSVVDIGAFESRQFSISATSGTPQTTIVNTAFGAPLVATVSSAFGEPVSGGQITFTAPGAGASATFTGGVTTISAAVNASGQASVSATANAIVGGPYNVTSTGIGVSGTANFALTNQKANQTINFAAIPNKTFGDADFMVSPTATSGLPVSLSASGQCTVTSPSPGTVHITAAGSCTITASQGGNGTYNPAPDVQQSFTIGKAAQTINFAAIPNKTFGDADFAVSATASSNLAVSFGATGNCTVTSPSPGTVHITAAGACTITASQAGNANFNAAPNVQQSFSIAKAASSTAVSSSANPSDFGQSVTFTATVMSGAGTPTGTVQFKDGAANLGAPVALNGSGVAQFSTSSLSIGTHTITAVYSGDSNFLTSTGTLSGGQVVKPQPSLSIDDVSITEGNAGTKTMTFTVTLSAVSSLTVTIGFITSNGTAVTPSDYVFTNGTLTFNPGETTKTIPVTINGDIGFEPNETFTVSMSAATNATVSKANGTGTIQNDDFSGGIINFSQVNTNVSESTGIVTLTVVRTNDVSQPVNVDYATDDTGASTNCAALLTGLASQRCDFTTSLGTLKFAANETQKTVSIPINLDAYAEGPETFTVTLSNPTGGAILGVPATAIVTINDSASPTPNAIDDTTNFVRQQYRDFLNREADPAGLAFWTDNIDKCNDPLRRPAGQTVAQCIEVQRIVTSAAFFLSIEFKQTGGMVREFYVAALDRPATNNMPNYTEFMRDTQTIQRGVVVGQGNWQQVLDANRTAFMNEFVLRPEFVGLYPTTDTPTQYVDKLYLHANVVPGNAQERLDAIAEFGGAPTAANAGARGRALLRITQNAAFQAREYARTFVQIEYFGYLRRNPNDLPDGNFNGYNFWVNKLNQFNGDFLQAEMVKAFLNSLEYRARFGP